MKPRLIRSLGGVNPRPPMTNLGTIIKAERDAACFRNFLRELLRSEGFISEMIVDQKIRLNFPIDDLDSMHG